MRRALAVLAILILAAPAHAHFGKGENTARQVAEARWDACDFRLMGHVAMPFGAVSWADIATCRVWLGPTWHDYGFKRRCTWLVHEVGHLAGRSHSSDPTNLMYPAPRLYAGCTR